MLSLNVSLDGIQPGLQLPREPPLESFALVRADLRLKLACPGKKANESYNFSKQSPFGFRRFQGIQHFWRYLQFFALGEPTAGASRLHGHRNLKRGVSFAPGLEKAWRNVPDAPASVLDDSRASLEAVVKDGSLLDGPLALQLYPDNTDIGIQGGLAAEVADKAEYLSDLRADLHRDRECETFCRYALPLFDLRDRENDAAEQQIGQEQSPDHVKSLGAKERHRRSATFHRNHIGKASFQTNGGES